mmetsp:Transcript_12484/g.15493  ORF Transcript_12484/g.15493 Transcript_12484/m.15493 type:complete len:307 (+) Transcript_12484:80-1000(+)
MAVRRRSGKSASATDKGRNVETKTKPASTVIDKKSRSDKNGGWRMFSSNPDKRWAEKVFLFYSPVWPLLFGGWCLSGWYLKVGDVGNMLVTCLIATPNVLIPLLFCPTKAPVVETYWFKFGVWIGIFAFVASYFFTDYFFDVLGMIYNFPHLEWNLSSVLVGTSSQVVPLMMYVHAWYFFITYHTCSVIFMRCIRTSILSKYVPLLSVISVVLAAWVFSVGEIYGTTLEAIREQFHYVDMEWALSHGALAYACYFISSFPMVYNMDEEIGVKWTLTKTIENALAASMIAFTLLDLVCQFVITGWQK